MPTKARIPTAVWIMAISIVLSVAVYFHFWQLNSLSVLGPDQGRALLAGRNILQGQVLLLGPATDMPGINLGPLYYYLTAASLAISNYQLWGPAFMVSLLGVIAVMLGVIYGSITNNLYYGLGLGLLLSVSPLLVWQSRIPLESSLLPLFTIGWLVSFTWWIKTKNNWSLLLSLVLIVLALQSNLSALILLLTTVVMYIDIENKERPTVARFVKTLIISVLTGALVGKLLAGTEITPASYWWHIWQKLTIEITWLSTVWLLLASLGLWRMWLNREVTSTKTVLWWLAISSFVFSIKYVSGEYALATLFIVPSLLIMFFLGDAFSQLRFVINKQFSLLTTISLLILLALSCQHWLYQKPQNQIKNLEHKVALIEDLTHKQEFNFIYRGHLDIYDAADDHYQYLMWLQGIEPNQSARRYLKEPYLEKWQLQTKPRADQTIVMYYPPQITNEYPQLGTQYYYEDLVLEIITTK